MGQADIITDHAFIRWLERVYGLNVDALKASMVDETIAAAAEAGAHAVKKGGVKYIIAGGRVVTVLTKEQRVKRKDRRHVVDLDFDATNGNGPGHGAVRMQKENTMLNVEQKAEAGKTNGLFSDEQVAVLQQRRATGIGSRVVTLTPAMAKELLAKNPSNRRISEKAVNKFTADILGGLWAMNGEPIIVSDTGELNDGQHRCMAVIQAGRPIQTLLVEGVPREARITTDMGRARKPGDLFSMSGVKDGNLFARVATLLATVEKMEQIRPSASGADTSLTKQRIYDFGQDHLEEIKWANCLVYGKKNSRFRKSILALALILIGRRAGRGTAEIFINDVVRGDHVNGASDPIYVTRERLLSHTRAKPISPHSMMEIIIKGWNAYRRGRTLRLIKVTGMWPEISR